MSFRKTTMLDDNTEHAQQVDFPEPDLEMTRVPTDWLIGILIQAGYEVVNDG